MLLVRQAYGCDCDGASHKTQSIDWSPALQVQRSSVQAWLGAIESVVMLRPHTCPWRAQYHPLVGEVVDVLLLAEKSIGMAKLGDDPPAILLDAIGVYERARTTAYARNLERRREEEEKKRKR